MGQLTQTTTELQAIVDNSDAANVGKTSLTDGSDTTAVAFKKSGFYSLQGSSANAPSTDRAVLISAVRNTAATGEIRYGQIAITESNGLWWNRDDGGSLGTWYAAVSTTGTQTLTNKTLTSPVLTTPQINDSAADHQYIFAGSDLAADRTITLPLLTGNDTFVFEAHTQTLTNKTLTAPTVSALTLSDASIIFEGATADDYETTLTVTDPTADRTITLPNATDTLVGRATTDTLTNKTLTSPIASGLSLSDASIVFEGATADDHETTLIVTDPTADRTITLPDATDTLVGRATTDTLTNKTLTSPIASGLTLSDASIVFEGATADAHETTLTVTDPTADRTITLPNATDTLVGLATTDTLTNKTLTSPVFNTGVSGTAVLDADDFDGASATTLASSESIKAYVDTKFASGNELSEVLAAGNVTGANDIDVENAQKVQFRDSAIYINSSADGQLDIVADTEIQIAATTVDLNGDLDVSGTIVSAGKITADAGIDIDNINIDGTTIALSSGDLTLDAAGDINLDADGADINLKDGGTAIGRLGFENGDLNIASSQQDYDIKLKGNDGGSIITALALDMSAAGAATFNSSVTADGLTVEGNGTYLASLNNTAQDARLQLSREGTEFGQVSAGGNLMNLVASGASTDMRFLTNSLERMRIAADGSLSTPTAGTSNVRFGVNAGNSIASGGNYNVVVGDEAGTAITTGDGNVFTGYASGDALTLGSSNTAVGRDSLGSDTKGNHSVAIGRNALTTQNFTSATDAYNTAVGSSAGADQTLGINNTYVGAEAGKLLTDADSNVAVGAFALDKDELGSKSTAIGYAALSTQDFTSATDTFNTAVGFESGVAVTTGTQNTLLGALAGDGINSGSANVALGYNSLSAAGGGNGSIAIGKNALAAQNAAGDRFNTAVGHAAGTAVTSGIQNTFVGGLTGAGINVGGYNVAAGFGALSGDTKGNKNTAIGWCALETQNFTDGTASNNDSFNTALGYEAGHDVTSGTANTLIGGRAGTGGTPLTTGDSNTFVGFNVIATTAGGDEAIGLGHNMACAPGFTTLGSGASDIRAAHGTATWAAVSDQRYKKDIVDSTAGLSFINALQPRTFKYKTLGELPETFRAYEADSTKVFKNANTNHGFIAQEIKAAIDADNSIKNGFKLWDERDDGSQEVAEAALIPVLVKAIQELSAQNAALTARIETLEG